MKIISISGPTGAGKDSVVDEILAESAKLYPGRVAQAPYYKTRPIRPGEKNEDYFISEQEFQDKLDSGTIPDAMWGQIGTYRVGHDPKDFEKSEITVINIDDKKARRLREAVTQSGGKCLTIFLHAPESTRIQRFSIREGWLFDEPAKDRVDHDVTDPIPENHSDFDMVVENKEGQFAETMKEIMPKVKEFIESK